MALAAKRARSRKRATIAAVEEAEEMEDGEHFVAVVGMSSSVIGDGTNSDSDEYIKPTPPSQKHLFLNCYIPSPTSEILWMHLLIMPASQF